MLNVHYRFVSDISSSTLFNNPAKDSNEPQFVIKLPFSTNSQRIKRGAGVAGILTALKEFMNDDRVWNYIPSALIQPEIRENAEIKVVCFNGKAIFRNKIKKSKNGRSPFGRKKNIVYFDFAEHVISVLRMLCPEIVSDQILRVDLFGIREHPGLFLVNEIEGYESAKWGTGVSAGDNVSRIIVWTTQHWITLLCKLVDYHLARLSA